jgi:cytochrome P450
VNKPIDQRNFFEPETLTNPFEFYKEAHAADMAIQYIEAQNTYIVYDYNLVSEATGRVDEFSNDFSSLMGDTDPEIDKILEGGWPNEQTLLTVDPPIHTRFRKLVNLAFSMPRVNAIEDDMRKKAISLIDGLSQKNTCEFVDEFAVPLPVAMISQQIGLDNDPKQVKSWSDAAVDRFSQLVPRERLLECAHSFIEFQHYMKDQIVERRAQGGDDLLTDLVEARIDGEDPLTDPEIMSIMQQFMVAGNETTTSTIAGLMMQLIRNPDQMEIAVAAAGGKDAKIIGNMVEESLRYETPSAGMWRIVMKDSELGGVKIPKGATLQLRYAGANRDPKKFENPDKFDIQRKNARAHLAFGKGIHMCVGNMLSRKEIAVAFDEILVRLTNFKITDEDAITILPNILLRGVTKLPISYEKIA